MIGFGLSSKLTPFTFQIQLSLKPSFTTKLSLKLKLIYKTVTYYIDFQFSFNLSFPEITSG